MKVLLTLILAGTLAGCGAMANQRPADAGSMRAHGGMHGNMHGNMHGRMHGKMHGNMAAMSTHMQGMDANGDGMLSKEEFMKAHEAMFDAMKKNERGQVAMSDMAMCPMMRRQ